MRVAVAWNSCSSHYMPEIGRVISEDPHPGVAEDPLTLNSKYIYVSNNPLGYIDPSGKFLSDVAKIGIAAITVGLVVGGVGPFIALTQAIFSVAGAYSGAVAVSGIISIATGDWSTFNANRDSIFNTSVSILAFNALASIPGGGLKSAGTTNFLQGSITSKSPIFGQSGGISIGSGATFSGTSGSSVLSSYGGVGLNTHEFGHFVQFASIQAGVASLGGSVDQGWLAYGIGGVTGLRGGSSYFEKSSSSLGFGFGF